MRLIPAPGLLISAMHKWCFILTVVLSITRLFGDETLLQTHCSDCHNDEKSKGKFNVATLGSGPTSENYDRWLDSLDLVTSGEMPPEDDSKLSDSERSKLAKYLDKKVRSFAVGSTPKQAPPRRLNNREFANSVRDVLLLEDIGTNLPTANLIGDSLMHGFDTHAETLGFSRFHLEQHLEAVRKIVNATILSGEQPAANHYPIEARDIIQTNLQQSNQKRKTTPRRRVPHFDFLDPKLHAYFANFETAPATGYYKIKIRATGKDRFLYSSDDTGVYHGDPIQLEIRLGDRERIIDLPDEEETVIELKEWVAEGSRLELHHPTDGLRMRSNGNFKFQYAIAGEYLRKNDQETYQERLKQIRNPNYRNSNRGPNAWMHWTGFWQGPRPRLYEAEIEGPLFDSWPPKRQVALIGKDPKVEDAKAILTPIAERAWRRPVRDGELDDIVDLVERRASTTNDIEALKEGIVSILVSPAFILLNTEDVETRDRFASKLSYFLHSTLPDEELRKPVNKGEFNSLSQVTAWLGKQFETDAADEFLTAFPKAWLELDDINFMSPDPEEYPFYHKKNVSDDMIDEVLAFFRNAVQENLPIPEFLSADYSFINADLATIYGVENVPEDSKFRKYTFSDERRGGLTGMGAFLTSTADSLSTSPIHRAIYVMENFLGIHPTPPPPDVVITEPDVRQAKTIKEILDAHTTDASCASCHKAIDPWGYAFENFGPTGAWRDSYTAPSPMPLNEDGVKPGKKKLKKTSLKIPVDASAEFRNGNEYNDITEYRKLLLTAANRDRFVRCFITKLLTYANGVEPDDTDFVAIDNILSRSAEKEYRIVDTIAAVINSPLFREE
ncbi:MAG: DUF1592 domain-containing protein [Verrucomicrobiales bacterium]|nr:DUF1592 domain-containing protein [Verrucomicrobiales bacterium]